MNLLLQSLSLHVERRTDPVVFAAARTTTLHWFGNDLLRSGIVSADMSSGFRYRLATSPNIQLLSFILIALELKSNAGVRILTVVIQIASCSMVMTRVLVREEGFVRNDGVLRGGAHFALETGASKVISPNFLKLNAHDLVLLLELFNLAIVLRKLPQSLILLLQHVQLLADILGIAFPAHG